MKNRDIRLNGVLSLSLSHFSSRNCTLVLLLTVLTWAFCFPFFVDAQEEAATVTSVIGDVMISIQDSSPIPGTIGAILVEGDSLRTRDASNAAVEFIDMSAVELEENTAVSVSIVVEDPLTGGSRVQLNLWWGNLRSLLPGDIPVDSSITIETINARTEIGGAEEEEFSGADAEVNYDPGVDTTIAVAHKFDVVMTNLLTEESLLVPEGNIGIVQGSTIQTMDLMIFFPTGRASLMEIIESQGEGEYTVKAQLDRVALVLKQLPIQQISIEGHTDHVGTEEANLELSQRRANNVKKYFVEYHELPEELFQTVFYGESRPLDTNATEEGRARNRRVEVHY